MPEEVVMLISVRPAVAPAPQGGLLCVCRRNGAGAGERTLLAMSSEKYREVKLFKVARSTVFFDVVEFVKLSVMAKPITTRISDVIAIATSTSMSVKPLSSARTVGNGDLITCASESSACESARFRAGSPSGRLAASAAPAPGRRPRGTTRPSRRRRSPGCHRSRPAPRSMLAENPVGAVKPAAISSL